MSCMDGGMDGGGDKGKRWSRAGSEDKAQSQQPHRESLAVTRTRAFCVPSAHLDCHRCAHPAAIVDAAKGALAQQVA